MREKNSHSALFIECTYPYAFHCVCFPTKWFFCLNQVFGPLNDVCLHTVKIDCWVFKLCMSVVGLLNCVCILFKSVGGLLNDVCLHIVWISCWTFKWCTSAYGMNWLLAIKLCTCTFSTMNEKCKKIILLIQCWNITITATKNNTGKHDKNNA